MGQNLFRNASDRVKKSGMVIPVTGIFILMLVVSLVLSYEDYTTSRLGYVALPTQKANPWVAVFVALLPQLGQIGFAYVFITDTNKRWAFFLTGAFFVADVFTDVYFKVGSLSASWILVALGETITIYTLGSELMLTTSVAMLTDLLPDFFSRLGIIGAAVIGSIQGDDKKPQGQQTPMQVHGKIDPRYRVDGRPGQPGAPVPGVPVKGPAESQPQNGRQQ